MKKIISLILFTILICTSLFGLTACAGSDGDVEALSAQVAELTEQLEGANDEIAELEAEKAEQSAEITSLKADLETLRAEKIALESEKASLEEEITNLETETARLKALMDGNSNALLEEISKLEEQVETLEAKAASLNSTKEDLEARIVRLNDTVTNLEALVGEINEASAKKDEEIAALRKCLEDIHTFKDGVCTTCGKEGKKAYTREGDYIYFGEYPQTLKADSVTITSTTDERGYYLGDDGCYYAKVSADPHYNDFTFSTGASITKGTVYYFKVEPIRWRILSEENGEAFLLCDSIIDVLSYQWDFYDRYQTYYNNADGVPEGTYANNYKYSEIRAWLNATFYETAFSALQQEIILITEVDNSAKSTNPHGNETAHNGGVNEYVCENTNDKIFLLSQEEATNEAYGFSSSESADESREMITSDYSRALGALMITTEDYYGNGWWYHRSPDCNRSGYAYRSSTDGHCNSSIWVDYTNLGTVPALRIQL